MIQEVLYGTEVVKKIRFQHHNVAVRISSLIVERDKNVTRQHGNGLDESLCRTEDVVLKTPNISRPISYAGFSFSSFIQRNSFHRV